MLTWYIKLIIFNFTISSTLLISFSKCEERIERKTEELKESETKADEAERKANALENRSRTDDEKIETLEDQLKVSVVLIYFS